MSATITRTPAAAASRLILVYREDPSGRYEWLGSPRPRDVLVAFEGASHADLADRGALLFDRLASWEERSAAEHRVDELLEAVRAHPRVAAIELAGYRLIDFAAIRLREELTRLLRGWELTRVLSRTELLVCDPAVPAALEMGARAGLGLDPATVRYTLAPELGGPSLKRALARPVMRAVAGRSRPGRVRVAAVAAGKLMLALAALSGEELRAAGVGTMPFPGVDHGNSALLALRRRLPMLATFGPAARRQLPGVRLPERLLLAREEALDRALALLVARLLNAVAPDLDGAVRATAGLARAPALRALLLPTAAYGASQLLIEWAHRRGMPVGVMQHGIYSHRKLPGDDYTADVIFSWGEGTADQTRDWPRPRLVPVGVPGMPHAPPRLPDAPLRRALVVTTNAGRDMPIALLTLGEEFIDAVAPGLARLAAAGVELELRPHPNEDPERYRRLLARHDLAVTLAAGGSFAAAAARTDIVIASTSSVAFEAAALGLPVLMWNGGAPQWLRRKFLMAPWSGSLPGMFAGAEDFDALVGLLLERPPAGLDVARELRGRLAHYAQPFDRVAFAEGLRSLGG